MSQPRASVGANLARRVITLPLLLAAVLAATATLPLVLLGCLLLDAIRARPLTMPRTRAAAFFFVLLWCELVGVVGAFLLWATTVGGRLCGERRYRGLHYALQRWWSGTLFGSGVKLFSMSVDLDGEIPTDRPVLLLVRHSSTADTLLAAALLANPAKLQLRYVLKRELLWDPCLDVVGQRIPNAFVARRGSKGRDVAAISELAADLGPGQGVLIYPEGSRFSKAKLERGLSRLRDDGRDDLLGIAETFVGVLPPRLGGVRALLDAAPDATVVFVDHAGLEAATTFRDFWRGGLIGRTIRVRLRLVDPNDVPRRGRDQWLFERWRELERWLAQHREDTADDESARAPERSGVEAGVVDLETSAP